MSVATPLPFSNPLPSEFDPLRKFTVPVGVPPLAAVTVAVSVSVWPKDKVVGTAVRIVVVEAAFTVTRMGGEEEEGWSVEEPA